MSRQSSSPKARKSIPIVCVQNLYNVAHRKDDVFLDELAKEGVAYVPFFPAWRVHAFTVIDPGRRRGIAGRPRRCRSRSAWLLQPVARTFS